MIIFHEGMPRSGKSYASTKDHIVPALKKGRPVYARLDGINFVQLAELAEITEDRCRELLVEISEEQMSKIWELPIPKDALVVLDELQNYWPQQKAPLSPPMTKFIAEHGHHGWDILCMGQLLRDCHRTWVNRTNRKIQFVKKDMLGKPNEYKWIMFTGRPDSRGQVKFDEVAKGDGTYEEQYFGCYASHSAGTENADTYADDRVNIFKSAAFRKWLPLTLLAGLISIGYIVYLFRGGLAEQTAKTAQQTPSAKPVSVKETVTTSGPGQPTKTVVVRDDAAKAEDKPAEKVATKDKTGDFDIPDLVADLSKENRIRVAAYIRSPTRTRIVIEWRDSSMRVIESLDGSDIEALGWHVLADNAGRIVVLARPGQRLLATAWPLDEPKGEVSEQRNQVIRETGRREYPELAEQQREFIPPKKYYKDRYAYSE